MKITLDVYYKKGKETSQLFDDAHDGYDYKKGRFSLRTFKVTGKKEELILQQHKSGDFDANYHSFKINFHNLPFAIQSVQIDNVEIELDNVNNDKNQSITINKEFTELHLFGN